MTHVIRPAMIAWKTKASIVRKPLRYAPSLVQRASTPVAKAQAPKNREIKAKANMARVIR